MKNHLKTFFIVCVIMATKAVFAGYGTNSFFVTVEDGCWTPEKLEIAATNAECQPAQNDLAGHWGKEIVGEQLSIRFEKSAFQSNEPVVATIIYRHSGTNDNLNYNRGFGGDLDFQFIIKDENGNELPDSFIPPKRISPSGSRWPPGTQYKFVCDLTKRYGLSQPSKYSIYVRRKLSILDEKGNRINLLSSTATIKIER